MSVSASPLDVGVCRCDERVTTLRCGRGELLLGGGPIWSGPLDASGERAITTPVRLLVEETLKGDVAVGEEVRFRQFGGRIGRTMMWFSDSVQFLTGERVLVALYRSDGEVGLMVDGGLHASRCKYVIARDGAVKHSPEPEIATLDQLRSRVLSAIGQ